MIGATRVSLVIAGASIIDGVSEEPSEGKAIWLEEGRIKAIARRDDLGTPSGAKIIDARGKYVIPGLMNANVHLMGDVRLENLVRYMGRYDELIIEAAQVALKNGLTTLFDTWGPRRFLMSARDRIRTGQDPGSRLLCAGNIIGMDGPFSPDFDYFVNAKTAASPALVNRIDSIWVENVGRHLMWLPPDQVAKEVRTYIGKGIDFVKYASNEHGASPGCFLAFSPKVQALIVEEAHRAGLTAQAHTNTVEGLRIAVEAGCNLIQHANVTGPVPIPESTLELMARQKVGAVVFAYTQHALEWREKATASAGGRNLHHASDVNARNLLRSGAPILLATDGAIYAPETLAMFSKSWSGLNEDHNSYLLATGHFAWLKAMEEKGMEPMEMLRAATRNIAVAYGVDRDLGTLERGKIADIVVLNKNPLQAAENYRSIDMILKDGAVVDRDALPIRSILTKAMDSPAEEEASYIPCFANGGTLPACPMCAPPVS